MRIGFLLLLLIAPLIKKSMGDIFGRVHSNYNLIMKRFIMCKMDSSAALGRSINEKYIPFKIQIFFNKICEEYKKNHIFLSLPICAEDYWSD